MTDLAAISKRNKRRSARFELLASIYSTNGWWLFAGIGSLYIFFSWYLNTEVLTDQVYFYSLGNQVGTEKLSAFLDAQHRMSFLGYLFIPLMLLLKIALVAVCLLTGLLLTNNKLAFRTLCKIALFAETAFVAAMLLKLVLLCFFYNVESVPQYTNFAPLSLFSLLPSSSVPFWLSYPLQTLDLFQAAYIVMLSAGLAFYCRQPFKKMLWLSLGSYGAGLLCCMIGFAFLTFSNS